MISTGTEPLHTSPVTIHPERVVGGIPFDFSHQIAVMAIINRTPDSFYDQGKTFQFDAAVAAAVAAVDAGADWVDIGGVKFAPGPELSAQQEIERVLPVVEAVAEQRQTVISVDTFHPEVAAACIEAGAGVINDTTGIFYPELASVVAQSEATLVVTHSLAEPRKPLASPSYHDVVSEVIQFLSSRVAFAQQQGIPLERLVIDPGHDLNKNTLHSLAHTRHFDRIAELGLPTLAAVSRKDFIGETLGREKSARLPGTIAAVTTCALLGARIVRVHDVPETVDAVRMVEGILGMRNPVQLVHNV